MTIRNFFDTMNSEYAAITITLSLYAKHFSYASSSRWQNKRIPVCTISQQMNTKTPNTW